MPSPAKCAALHKAGSKEYKDCIAYKGASANKAKANPVKGSLKKPVGGGY